ADPLRDRPGGREDLGPLLGRVEAEAALEGRARRRARGRALPAQRAVGGAVPRVSSPMDTVRHVLFHAPSRDPFFDRPAAIGSAVRACPPPGFSLVVADDASALVSGLREAVAYVGWAFPPSLAKRAKKLRYAYFLQAGIPEAFAHATNAAGEPIAVDTS